MENGKLVIRWKELPHARAALACAMRRVGYRRIEAIFIEWPHLREACVRLAAVTGGELLPDAEPSEPLLAACLRAGALAMAYGAQEDGLASFVRSVSSRAAEGVLRRTAWLHMPGIMRRWEPMESTLLDALEACQARAIELSPEPHPMRGRRDALLVVASRVFSLRDLDRAGVIDAASV